VEVITIYTTQRCIAVKGNYEEIKKAMEMDGVEYIEATEIVNSELPPFEPESERTTFIAKNYIVEVVDNVN
jgi:carbonic anhydrase